MGRGLSKLQEFILTETANRGSLSRDEIREGFFGWTPTRERMGCLRFSKYSPPRSQEFLDSEKKNKRISPSISRAITRLEQRELLLARKKEWYGTTAYDAILTTKGKSYVRENLGIQPKRPKPLKVQLLRSNG